MVRPADVTGVILAGGLATRLGGISKGLLRHRGRTLVEIAKEALEAVAGEMLLCANDPEPWAALGLPCIPDRIRGIGPIGGLEAALARVATPWALVVACDLPALGPKVLALLRDREERFDAVVPRVNGRLEPLCARYASRALGAIRDQIARGEYGMRALLPRLVVEEVPEDVLRTVDPELRTWANANTPEDVERLGLSR